MNKIDLSIFIAESIASNRKAYKHIDEIFNKKRELYTNAIQTNTKWNELKIAKEGTFEQEYYFPKVLAILDSIDKDDVSEDIINLLKIIFKPAYNFINSRKKLVLKDFIKMLGLKYKGLLDDELNGNVIAVIVLANALEIELDKEDELYIEHCSTLKQRLYRYEKSFRLNSANLEKEERKLLQKTYLKLRNKYIRDFGPNMHNVTFDKMDYGMYITEKFDNIDKFLIPFVLEIYLYYQIFQ